MSKETVTLDNFADFRDEVGGVEIRSYLPLEPYVPSTEIDIHLGRIARAASLGHLGSVSFRHYSERSSITAGVDSVGEDGSASASLSASATQTPRIDTKVGHAKDIIINKGHATVRFNLGHDDLNEVNLREAQAWSQYLDKATREGLRSSGDKKLTKMLPLRFFIGSAWVGIPVIDAALGGNVSEDLLRYAMNTGIFNVLAGAGSHFFSKDRRPSGEHTLMPGLPLDRIGLLQAYTHTRKFVEAK